MPTILAALAIGCGSAGAERPGGFDPVAEDPPPHEADAEPDLVPVVVEDHGPRLVGVAFVASGRGPHPTLLFLHGFPGHETNHDLARVLQRAGWNVVVIHYRGSWGSEGAYSFVGAREDVIRTLAFVRHPENAKRLRVDTDRIVLAGHSFGGFLALSVAAFDPEVRGVASIAGFDMGEHARIMARDAEVRAATVEAFEDALPPLRGTTAEGLVDEMLVHADAWSLTTLVPRLLDRPVLLVTGARDDVAPSRDHHRPLVDLFRALGEARMTEVTLRADHDFSSVRIGLARHLLAWLEPNRRSAPDVSARISP